MRDCPRCKGAGLLGFNHGKWQEPWLDNEALCPDCGGTGQEALDPQEALGVAEPKDLHRPLDTA